MALRYVAVDGEPARGGLLVVRGFAPGTGTPVPGGLSPRGAGLFDAPARAEALQLLRALAGLRLVGMDVVEVCPPLDHADLTSHLACHVLFEGLALAAISRAARPGGTAGAVQTAAR
jgi:agmatinase